VVRNPINRLALPVSVHYGLPRAFLINDSANTDDLALAVKVLQPLGNKGMSSMAH